MLVEEVKRLLQQKGSETFTWNPFSPSGEELALFRQEATTPSQFDPLQLKKKVWNAYESGRMQMQSLECPCAKVMAILPEGVKIPTEDWGTLFRWLGPPKTGDKWRVFWLGATTPRKFPARGPLAAEHLNGGYTNVCSTRGIFIYRIEEATRVLIHEMMHAACLDPPVDSIPLREATTEAWAELLLVAYRSRGNPEEAVRLWSLQSRWIADTNARASDTHNVRGNAQYGWRYLNGRKEVLEHLGIQLPHPSRGPPPTSSRFTHPELGD